MAATPGKPIESARQQKPSRRKLAPPSKRVTLRDVARAAKVSVMTVSNVVSGQANVVRPETRRKVEEAITRLKYRPNLNARSLRLSQAHSVGILIADNDPSYLSDPFISRLVSGLSNFLSSLDYTLDVQGVTPERFENAAILRKAGNDALCAILCGPRPLRLQHLGRLKNLDQPVVVLQEKFDSPSKNVVIVRQDDFAGGEMVGSHLARTRIRSVLFLRPIIDWCAIEQRYAGLRAGLARARYRISLDERLILSEGFEDTVQGMRSVLATNPPDAIVAATDSMAVAAMTCCEEAGMRVPKDISIAGFNGFDVWRYTRPVLTTIMSPAYQMGRYAGEAIVTRLRQGAFPERAKVFPVSFQAGGST
ncbi:MAG: LacI family transcriptional regulator [Pseudomonadota bacterium]|nr:LacI family transcriptional regulator [Pseudomonadota bacterium]